MKKKERKARLRAKVATEAGRPKDTKVLGVTVGGPKPGLHFVAQTNTRAHRVMMPENPAFSAAVYRYTPQRTKLGEMVALFNHCLPRT